MKKELIFISLMTCFCFLYLSLIGEEKNKVIKGQMASPIINDQGELQFIYRDGDSTMSLATQNITGERKKTQKIMQRQGVCSPVINRDKNNQINVLWVENDRKSSAVFLGNLKDSKLSEFSMIYKGKGYLYSPDFCFDLSGDLWAVWVIHFNSKNSLMVKNKNMNKNWTINSYHDSEAQGPKILVDKSNKIWLFWTGIDRGRESLFYSFFNGIVWSVPKRINKNEKYPHVLLQAEIGPEGLPWLVWSAYDGEDYEIYLRYWNKNGWSSKEQITNNLSNDIFPDIDFVWGSIPILVWSQYSKKENRIICRYKNKNQWTEEIELIKGYEELIRSTQIVTDQGQIGLVWEARGILNSKILYLSDLHENLRDPKEKTANEIIINPSLRDNVYIGFGDSITYGYIDSLPAPDKGYVPRLEEKLTSIYGDTEVINEGNPSEITLGGLDRISDVISEHEGRYLFLMEGTNDVITNSITMDTTAFNLQEMAKKCLDFGVLPLLATIIPRCDQWGSMPYFKERLYDLNDKIREIPGPLKIPFIDMFNNFYYYQEVGLDWKDLLSNDGLHPNEQGYEFMTDKWLEEIKIFPFPPTIIEGKRTYDEILFNSELRNLIIWRESPKLSYEKIFKGYRIYRKMVSEPLSEFREIAFLPIAVMVNYTQYFDNQIKLGQNYCYVVSLVRQDEVEGPCSNMLVIGSVE